MVKIALVWIAVKHGRGLGAQEPPEDGAFQQILALVYRRLNYPVSWLQILMHLLFV